MVSLFCFCIYCTAFFVPIKNGLISAHYPTPRGVERVYYVTGQCTVDTGLYSARKYPLQCVVYRWSISWSTTTLLLYACSPYDNEFPILFVGYISPLLFPLVIQ